MAGGKIAKITDVDAAILLSVVADTGQSVIDGGGTEFGSGTTYDLGLGFNTGSDGGLNFSGYATSGEFLGLDGQGQIVWKATPIGVTQYDVNATGGAGTSFVSGSNGYNRTTTGSLLTNRQTGGGAANATITVTSGEFTVTKYVAAASNTPFQVHSYPDNTHLEHCFSWDDTDTTEGPTGTWILIVDGAPVSTGEMGTIVGTEIWFQTIFGTTQNGGGNFLGSQEATAYQMDLIVSSDPVAAVSDYGTIGVFGDSFADFFTRLTDSQALNLTGAFQLPALFFNNLQQSVTITPDANGGFSMCDTVGGSNLVNEFAAFVATDPKIALVFGGNNDCTDGTDAEVSNATTGTKKRYEELITDLFDNGVTERVVIFTAGSMASQDSIDTSPNRARCVTVRGIQLGLEAFGNTLSSGFVQVVDLFTLLGGDSFSVNYIGWLSTLGNNTSPGVSVPDNRHPSGQGSYELSTAAFSAIFAVAGSPTLTTPYFDQFNDNGDVANVNISTNISGGSSFSATGLPPGTSINAATGVITGTITQNGNFPITINARNAQGVLAPPALFNWFVGAQAQQFRKLEQIGSNGNWYSYTEQGLTIAEMNAAYFSNQYVASVLKTNDYMTVTGSDGTRIYQVTVIPESRTVTLTLSIAFS